MGRRRDAERRHWHRKKMRKGFRCWFAWRRRHLYRSDRKGKEWTAIRHANPCAGEDFAWTPIDLT